MKFVKIALAAMLVIALGALPVLRGVCYAHFNHNLQCDETNETSIIFFVIDVSDKIQDDTDKQRILQEIKNTIEQLPQGSRFVLLSPNWRDPYMLNSPNMQGTCIVPPLDSRYKLVLSKEAITAFETKRQDLLETARSQTMQLLNSDPAPRTPLMETLIAISKLYAFRNSETRTLYMFSDMEQNSPSLSVYTRDNRRSAGSRAGPPLEQVDLRGTTVFIQRIVRPTKRDIVEFEKIKTLWDNWFRESNTSTVRWEL